MKQEIGVCSVSLGEELRCVEVLACLVQGGAGLASHVL